MCSTWINQFDSDGWYGLNRFTYCCGCFVGCCCMCAGEVSAAGAAAAPPGPRPTLPSSASSGRFDGSSTCAALVATIPLDAAGSRQARSAPAEGGPCVRPEDVSGRCRRAAFHEAGGDDTGNVAAAELVPGWRGPAAGGAVGAADGEGCCHGLLAPFVDAPPIPLPFVIATRSWFGRLMCR
jgi:hypothetical protein